MNKKLLILIAFISSVLLFSLKTNAQVCQNLDAGDDVQMQCTDTEVTLTATVIAPNYKTTRNYDVGGELMCPPVTYDGSRSYLQSDDSWSDFVIDIPFTFCFFENQYDQLVISGNGIVTFDLTVEGQYSSWVVDNGITLPTQEWQTNAIFGVFHDMDSSVDPREDRISYKTEGTAPNRVFIVSFEAFQYSCNNLLSKSQIKLYESSNVIDIVVDEKPVCSNWNGGRAVVGIQNKSGTIGVAPPDRNNGVWTPAAGGELWRFVPNGQDMDYTLNWFDQDGNQINANNVESITVNPQEVTEYTVELTLVDQCNDSTAVVTDSVTVTPGFTPDIQNPVDLTECENPAGSGTFDFNIDQTTFILNGLNPADFNISYHTSFADAQANVNPITVLNPYTSAGETIYIRVEDVNDATCATIREFTLTVISQNSANITYTPSDFCLDSDNPFPDPDSFYPGGVFSINNGGVIDMNTGEVKIALSGLGTDNTGNFTITYDLGGACPFQGTFDILIKPISDSSFAYATNQYCNDDTNPSPSSVTTPGGTFTINNGGVINAITGEVDLAASGLGINHTGNFMITYTTDNMDCPSSSTQNITIELRRDASFVYPATACIGGVNPTPVSIVEPGGAFTVDNGATIDAVTGELDLSTTIVGVTYTVTYSFAGFCPSSSSNTIDILPMDDSSFAYATYQYCDDDTNPLPSSVTTPGGTFTIDNGGVINATTGEVDLATSGLGTDGTGNFTITYTTSGNCPTSSTQDITIELRRNASFVYPATACIGGTNPTPVSVVESGGTFTVDNGATINAVTGELDLSTTTAGTTYTVTYSFTGFCPSSSSNTIDILPMDDSNFAYATYQYCNDDANPLPSNVTTPGGTFTIDNGGVINATTGEVDLSASGLGTDGTGNFTITYTTLGNCPTSSTQDITIELRRDASFDYPSEVCSTDVNPMPSNIVETGGVFSVDNGATIDAATGELDLASTVEGQDYVVSYTLSGFCPDVKLHTIHINESPTATTPTTILSSCNKGDGTADFDVSTIESEIIGSQTDVTVTYHATESDAVAGANAMDTTPFLVAPGNVWVRVENAVGCYATVEIPLVIEDCVLIIPQGFSPASNIPENQTFYLPLIRTKYPNFKVYVYNRFGNEVYKGDVNTDFWNGKLNNEGDLLPAGTYFYGIKLNDEQDIQYRGWVYLNY